MHASSEKLITEYLERRAKNSRYSERAFAKCAGLSPGFMKLVFQGKRGLSLEKAREVANRLGWSGMETEEFLLRVQTEKLAKRGKPLPAARAVNSFSEISDWYHFAIAELLKVRKRISLEEISRRLGISITEAEYSLRALERAGIIRFEDGLPEVLETYVVPAMSSSGIRKFHAQMLEKARDSLEGQPVAVRDIRGLTLAFDSRKQAEAEAAIKDFMKRFEKRFGTGRPDKVYQLSLAFFSLEKESNA